MIRRLMFVALCGSVAAGCDEDALRMAQEARQVLATYEKELERKLAAEQLAYRRQAQVHVEAEREQLFSTLEQERLERSRSLALDVVEGDRRVTRWREPLRDYAKADYLVQRDLLLRGLDSDSRFLERIQALQVDKQKVAALSKALGMLTEKTGIADEVKALAEFVSDTRTDFDARVCDSLAAQLKDATAAVAKAASDAEKKKAQSAVTLVTAARAQKDCK